MWKKFYIAACSNMVKKTNSIYPNNKSINTIWMLLLNVCIFESPWKLHYYDLTLRLWHAHHSKVGTDAKMLIWNVTDNFIYTQSYFCLKCYGNTFEILLFHLNLIFISNKTHFCVESFILKQTNYFWFTIIRYRFRSLITIKFKTSYFKTSLTYNIIYNNTCIRSSIINCHVRFSVIYN